jgi:hypothetical protein
LPSFARAGFSLRSINSWISWSSLMSSRSGSTGSASQRLGSGSDA